MSRDRIPFFMVPLLCVLMLVLSECSEKRTEDPEKVYRYWSGGEDPPMDVHVVQGRYWERAHVNVKYELFLEIYAPKDWVAELIKKRSLGLARSVPDRSASDPEWYRPESGMIPYQIHPTGNTMLLWDSLSGHVLLHHHQY